MYKFENKSAVLYITIVIGTQTTTIAPRSRRGGKEVDMSKTKAISRASTKRVLALVLCALMLIGLVGDLPRAYASGADEEPPVETAEPAVRRFTVKSQMFLVDNVVDDVQNLT